MSINLPILVAEEAEVQALRAAGISLTAGRPGTRRRSDETSRRLAIIAEMRNLYLELRVGKSRVGI
jgi:hypothetical protein